MDAQKTFKAFNVDAHGRPHYLFHGNGGSTLVPLDQWVEADQKLVRDGTGNRWYDSAFHSLPDWDAVERWQQVAKTPRPVVEVLVRETHPKPSNPGVVLSRWLYVSSEEWNRVLEAFQQGA